MSLQRGENLTNITTNNQNGYILGYNNCTCCPYGYHIDLDFVRYCEMISKQPTPRTGSIKRRKDRRRQRKSMEVLLGITPAPLITTNLENNYKPIIEQDSPKLMVKTPPSFPSSLVHDGFDDAVSDFERTLQRSKKTNKLGINLPDVTAVTVLPTNNTDGLNNHHDFDTVSIESGLSPTALQNIREQMALSLERTKQLEEQVRLIPELKDQLMTLKEENRRLIQRLKNEEIRNQTANINYLNSLQNNNRSRSQSFSTIDNLDNLDNKNRNKKQPPPVPPRKDCGVMCGVLTRNIGVGHQNPNTKSVSTITFNGNDFEENNSDKWLNEKVRFMNTWNKSLVIAKGTQTLLPKEKREIGVQVALTKQHANFEIATQTDEVIKKVKSMGIQSSVRMCEVALQKYVECYSIGCSDDTIDDVICEKCSAFKCTVAVGPDSNEDAHTSPISLASLTSRSKSFNLGEDKLNLTTRKRTVASQYESNSISRAIQIDLKKPHLSKGCQHDLKVIDKHTQSDNIIVSSSKSTETKDLIIRKHVACEINKKKVTSDVGCNTVAQPAADKITIVEKVCNKCKDKDKAIEKDKVREKERIKEREKEKEKEKEDAKKDDTPSRIPRPQNPTTPVLDVRKFRRQDTYTKIYSPTDKSPTSPTPKLSGLDLSPKSISNEPNPLDKVKQNFKFPEAGSNSLNAQQSTTLTPQNGSASSPIKVEVHETTLPVSETTLFHPSGQYSNRTKAVPSKEMQGAMKVLNDSLLKNSKNIKNNSAINIVQQEWFKISSLVTANPLDVEDYLDAFEDMSAVLLQYIVNMCDASGNTAMHYAVSHGNFDVVSILLDSKVCDINKTNKAGYTSVMLVSLAEVRSQTHANVVKRLFQLADVNIRAKQHGQTALMLAVSHGRLDMVKMLLEAGADINIQDDDGSTALMCAAEHGHIEIVKHFLSQPDCDSSITDVDGSTALKIAMEAGHRHIGVLLYAHERNYQKTHGNKVKKTKSISPKTPSSPLLSAKSSNRALTDTKK